MIIVENRFQAKVLSFENKKHIVSNTLNIAILIINIHLIKSIWEN